MKKYSINNNKFYLFVLLSLFAKIIPNENSSLIKKFEENTDTFKKFLTKDTDMTEKENKKIS